MKCLNFSGKPPYPLVKDFPEDELEYVTRWLDLYQAAKSSDGVTNMGIKKLYFLGGNQVIS